MGVRYLEAPFSTPDWEPRSFRRSATLWITPSASLPLLSAPRRARLSMVAMRASRDGDMPVVSSNSELSP